MSVSQGGTDFAPDPGALLEILGIHVWQRQARGFAYPYLPSLLGGRVTAAFGQFSRAQLVMGTSFVRLTLSRMEDGHGEEQRRDAGV